MRAVVDTNLLISGLLWGRNPGRLLHAVQSGHLRLCMSEPLLSELGHVLRRPKLSPRLRARRETAEDILASVRSVCEILTPADVRGPAELRDPKDLAVPCGHERAGNHRTDQGVVAGRPGAGGQVRDGAGRFLDSRIVQ
ncbi:MAG: putative toxin-antitoxin system toxin component, PIN family, partial [Verrucomicrobia bacterium]|nr:putative toxin-antitoxin system toxin component, PIN family [Verrucomicrobiota bacterium]